MTIVSVVRTGTEGECEYLHRGSVNAPYSISRMRSSASHITGTQQMLNELVATLSKGPYTELRGIRKLI